MVKPRKYQPLVDYLAGQPAATTSVSLTLAEIEALVEAPLPRTAATRIWWHNARPYWRLLHAAGWRVVGFDVLGRRATFARHGWTIATRTSEL